MIKKNFQAVMGRRSELLHRQAVWQETIDHLRKFLDTDAAPAKHGIVTEGGGMVVPQPSIEAVIVEIQDGPQAKLLQELEEINKSEVAEHVRQENEASKEGKAQGRKAGRRRQPRT